MHTEYEVRVLEIDKDEVARRLEQSGAEFQWDYVQRRYVYDFIPKVDSKWIRLRTNGNKTTINDFNTRLKPILSLILKMFKALKEKIYHSS